MATESELAADFGYSLAFFKSNSELYKLLKSAVAGDWTPARFVAALQNTTWFRTTSESARKYAMLKASDPKTFGAALDQAAARALNLAGSMGLNLSKNQAAEFAHKILQMGLTDDQLRREFAWRINPDGSGNFTGAAGAAQAQIDQLVADYGVSVSQTWKTQAVRDAVLGVDSIDGIKQRVETLAASKYVALADRIKAGESVRQIADPYLQSYGKLLEVNDENLNLDDPLIQKALQSKDKDGKPATQTLYDFEQTLRNDPRWAKTQNAQNTMSSTASAILRQFGVVA